ncbi:FHA domain-containing protein [Rhizobium sp. CCGE 510]|uniref:FHA domain-containing protein n=1 Tax=Rhizobium sp. CCGE 510 TaxID=1132836 RepID=UPI000563034E|nr:FHA domain-containing protein [Rhizobium sp. CCGE 510]
MPGDAAGGLTTSRAGNSLVLPDDQQMVSKYHCSIECMARRYGLIDRGRGNTCLSDEAVRLPSEAPVARKTSDVIQIGAYRIDVVAVFLRGDLAVEQAFVDRGTHDVLLAAVQKAPSSVRARLSLAGIEKAMGRTRSLLHRNHKAQNRSAYVRVFNDVVSNIETDLLRSFGADFARPVRERRRPARRSHDESVRSEGKWAG